MKSHRDIARDILDKVQGFTLEDVKETLHLLAKDEFTSFDISKEGQAAEKFMQEQGLTRAQMIAASLGIIMINLPYLLNERAEIVLNMSKEEVPHKS